MQLAYDSVLYVLVSVQIRMEESQGHVDYPFKES